MPKLTPLVDPGVRIRPSIRVWLLGLPRFVKQLLLVATDLALLPLAVWLSYSLRLGLLWSPSMNRTIVPGVVAIGVGIFVFMYRGLYQTVVRYMNASAVNILLMGVSMAALAFSFVIQLLGVALGDVQPRSVPVLFWFIALLLIGGVRMFAQVYLRRFAAGIAEPVVIYGAGSTGTQLGSTLAQGYQYCVVGYVDDNPRLHRMVIHGVRVFAVEQIDTVVKSYGVRQIFLAVPSASKDRRREILSRLEPLALKVSTLPSMQDVISGRVRIDQVRDVDVDDLLGRDPVPPRSELLDACIRGKSVLVTGAGGSIGSELCRQIVTLSPKRLALFELSEYSLYQLEQELTPIAVEHGVELCFQLGNAQDKAHLLSIMRKYAIQTVYHAAAYKHVPIVEGNVVAGIRNNVFGTLAAAEAAKEVGVDTFVLISTDKAVRPTNVMGASKRIAEMILQSMAIDCRRTRFSMVRFGNVLGSSGSVVPLFLEQIRRGGPVTVTHPEVIRYFMTIPEAAQLVIQAGAMAVGGDVFLLDMGEPVRIADLARKMIHLTGLRVRDQDHTAHGDIEIRFVGLRPGEKLFEELLIGGDVSGTRHPRIMRANEDCLEAKELNRMLHRFKDLIEAEDEKALAQLAILVATDGGVRRGGVEAADSAVNVVTLSRRPV